MELIRGSSIPSGARRRIPGLLIVAQVAVSLVLLAEAAAMLQSFDRQAHAYPGYDPDHIVVASLIMRTPAPDSLDTIARANMLRAESAALRETALARIATLPGVERFAVAQGTPVQSGSYEDVIVDGHAYLRQESAKLSTLNVGPGYFATIGAAIIRGREFTNDDPVPRGVNRNGFTMAVINEAMARRFWPNTDPVGKRVAFRGKGSAIVVGVVRDMRDVSALDSKPRAYFPALEWFSPRLSILIRTREPKAMVERIRPALAGLPVAEPPVVRALADLRSENSSVARVAGITLAVCAAVALLLTGAGLYGQVAMWANERRTELGIRIALGAPRAHLHHLLIGTVARFVAIGIVVGLALSVALLRLERAWIGPVMTLEIGPMTAAALTLAFAAGVAAYIPARRAVLTSPAEAIRAT